MYKTLSKNTSKQSEYAPITWIFLICILGTSATLFGQQNISLFNLQGVPSSYGLHPGRMPLSNVYVGIPGITNLNTQFSNTGFDLGALIPDGSGSSTTDFFDSDFADIYDILGTDNQLLFDVQATWLDFGFRVKRNFFSFTLSDQAFFQLDFPKSVFELFDDIDKDIASQTNKTYDLGNLALNATHYRAYAFGYTRTILPNLSAGLRLKLLQGLGNARTNNENLAFETNISNATTSVLGSLAFYTSGLSTLETDPGSYWLGSGNSGLALDVGVQFEPSDKIELFASVLNLGGINWNADLSTDAIQSTSFSPSLENIENFEEDAQLFFDSLLNNTRSELAPYRSKLPAYGYLGGNYYLLPHTSVGALLLPRFFEGETNLAVSFNAQTRLRRIFQIGVQYTMQGGDSWLGAGASLNLGPVQVFAASDNISSAFRFEQSQRAHVNFGMNLSFGRRTKAEQQALWKPIVEEEEAFTELVEEEQELKPAKPARTKNTSRVNQPKAENTMPEERTDKPQDASTPNPSASLTRYVTLVGNAKAQATGELVKGVQVDVFVRRADGTEQFLQTHHFFNGSINIPLERDRAYRIQAYKNGIGKQAILLNASALEGKNQLEQQFILE